MGKWEIWLGEGVLWSGGCALFFNVVKVCERGSKEVKKKLFAKKGKSGLQKKGKMRVGMGLCGGVWDD